MADELNVAVAGMGGRGRYLGQAFDQHPNARLVAVCDTNETALALAKETFGDRVSYYADQEEMCAKADFQVGVVASWDPAHKENAVAFLQHRKHVYLEKPMAQTIPDCDAILRAWETSGKTLMVGLELRYCTLSQEIRRLLDAGEIGEVKLGMAVDNVSVGGQYYFHNNRRRKAFIKSLMIEKGIHTLDLMNWFIGSNPVRVFGEGGLDVFGGDAPNDKRCRDCNVDEYHPSRSTGGHGGGDPRILEAFIDQALQDAHTCSGALDARNSAAIAIAAAESCETHEAVEIPGFAFENPV